jgi:hypothetical protein
MYNIVAKHLSISIAHVRSRGVSLVIYNHTNTTLVDLGVYYCFRVWSGWAIDLVLIDPQSVGKRTHDLMDTANAKKRWKTIYWRVNKYLK